MKIIEMREGWTNHILLPFINCEYVGRVNINKMYLFIVTIWVFSIIIFTNGFLNADGTL